MTMPAMAPPDSLLPLLPLPGAAAISATGQAGCSLASECLHTFQPFAPWQPSAVAA